MVKKKYDAMIFIGGEFPEKSKLQDLPTSSLVIAADAGYLAAKELGYTVNHVIGDFDSLNIDKIKEDPHRISIHKFPKDKDFSDSELALSLAKKLGAQHPILIGGGGGRADHFLALTNIFNQSYTPAMWITKHEMIFAIQQSCQLYLEKEKTISFYALKEAPREVKSTGLKWELDRVKWKDGYFSLSNIVCQNPIYLDIQEGRILAIIPHEA
ncbi:MAG: thiamine diphosphokinase [Spirochaetia bacterium]